MISSLPNSIAGHSKSNKQKKEGVSTQQNRQFKFQALEKEEPIEKSIANRRNNSNSR